jgi:HrpA-like RNA helicase
MNFTINMSFLNEAKPKPQLKQREVMEVYVKTHPNPLPYQHEAPLRPRVIVDEVGLKYSRGNTFQGALIRSQPSVAVSAPPAYEGKEYRPPSYRTLHPRANDIVYPESYRAIFNDVTVDRYVSDWISSREFSREILQVNLPTGFGKSVMSILELCKSGYEAVILIPKVSPLKHLFSHVEGMVEDRFQLGYSVGGGDSLRPNSKVILHTYGIMERMMNSFEEKIRRIQARRGKFFVVLDEVHDPSWQTQTVFRWMLWMAKKYSSLNLIISSATFDWNGFSSTASEDFKINMVKIENEVNSRTYYEEKSIPTISGDKIGKGIIDWVSDTIVREVSLFSGPLNFNTLVILPGEEEIEMCIKKMRSKLMRIGRGEVNLYPLYSSLDDREKSLAINGLKGHKQDFRIIFATNIVEDSITINKLDVLIDTLTMKISCKSNDGVDSLELVPISSQNHVQRRGRVGRQGKEGKVFVPCKEFDMDLLSRSIDSELERNPLHEPVSTLIRGGYDPYEILSGIGDLPVDESIQTLLDIGFILQTGPRSYVTSPSGMYVWGFPVRLKSKKFMYLTKDLPQYLPTLIVSWLEVSQSIFYSRRQGAGESDESYDEFKALCLQAKVKFTISDSFKTFLNIWNLHPRDETYWEWCNDNFINGRTINKIKKFSSRLRASKTSQPFKDEVITFEAIDSIMPHLLSAYQDNVYELNGKYFARGVKMIKVNKYVDFDIEAFDTRLAIFLSLTQRGSNVYGDYCVSLEDSERLEE